MIQSVKHGKVSVMACLDTNETGSIVEYIDFLLRFNQLIGQHSSNPRASKAKKCNVLEWLSQSPDLNLAEHAFHTSRRQNCKQKDEGAEIKTWQNISKRENSVCGVVHGFWQHYKNCVAI